jgi:hypothetical protein
VERFEMMTCNSEQVVNLAVDREKSLNLCRRFETTQIFVRIHISVLSLQSFGRRVNRWHRNRLILRAFSEASAAPWKCQILPITA